ncbi:MAG TPA: branched-chain amino acid ABC transporter permease [Myxococcaceae bacterium]|nr:branched-chain amino acid ABC transporter permease [Myxococcaceae bacterium]
MERWLRGWQPFALLVAVLVAAPFVVYPVFLMKALCFALFACAFNLLLGQVGLLSFGHALFFGVAAYAAADVAKMWGLGTLPSVLLATLLSAALGLVVGAIAIRRQGIYFAMITLGLAQMVYFVCLQADSLTGGENGVQAVPRGTLFFGGIDLNGNLPMYFFVLAVFLAGFGVIARATHSPFGEVLRAIREHEPRAISLGYEVNRFKLVAFVLSAALTGMAGATKAFVFQLASLTDVDWQTSGEVVLMTLLGGMGRTYGPIFGAFLIVALESYLADFGGWVAVLRGVIFVVCVLAFRQGIAGTAVAAFKRGVAGAKK